MIIANPLYDRVFKRLMENGEVARFVIGTLLEQSVVSVDVKSQEFIHMKDEPTEHELAILRLIRLDFVATIQTETGEYKKVLIEMQKVLKVADISRFRKYIAEQYRREDTVEGEQTILPIVTIYILGFDLPEIHTACVRVDRRYYDAIHQVSISERSHFIERLTHDSVVVQALRIESGRYGTKLDRLLSVFEQNHFITDSEMYKDYDLNTDDADIRRITSILHYCATDAEERRRIEAEDEAWRSYRDVLKEGMKDNLQTIERQAKVIVEKEAALAEKNA
ncbi:MAG: hypothetical protein LBR08_05300, partial [Bacteroidales bacterium]|nr:hypothetical protein [Bacteroidales bacterium]